MNAWALVALWMGAVGVCIGAGALLVIAHNLNVLKIEIRYIFDLWQEHDTRWRRS